MCEELKYLGLIKVEFVILKLLTTTFYAESSYSDLQTYNCSTSNSFTSVLDLLIQKHFHTWPHASFDGMLITISWQEICPLTRKHLILLLYIIKNKFKLSDLLFPLLVSLVPLTLPSLETCRKY